MRGERNSGSRLAVSPLSLSRRASPFPSFFHVVDDDDAAVGYFASTVPRLRIIDYRARERRKSGLRETHSIPKGNILLRITA